MTRSRSLKAHLRLAGRCALSGLLAGSLAMQTFAETASTAPVQTPTQVNTESVPGIAGSLQIDATPAAKRPFAATVNTAPSFNALPDLPASFESASSVTPANLHLMLDDARQAAEALSSPPSHQKRIQRPGMLVLGIAGIPLMALGAYVYSIHTNSSKISTLKSEYGSAFFVPGAAMSGLGFYFAFHKKK